MRCPRCAATLSLNSERAEDESDSGIEKKQRRFRTKNIEKKKEPEEIKRKN